MPDSSPSSTPSTCAECGARLAPGQQQCDLCGTPVDAAAVDTADAASTEPVAPAATDGVYCNQCGWRNPAGARFCSQCGTSLQEVRAVRPPEVETHPADTARVASNAPLGRTLGIVLGAAVLLVVALFVITALSEKPAPVPPTEQASAEAPLPEGDLFAPLSAEQETAVASLERDLGSAQGADRRTKLAEMVNLLIGFGRPDLAAQAQQDLATEEQTPEAWTKAGDLYFQWMTLLEDGQGNPGPVALRALAAYDASLALRPEDHDVRARLAWAAQYDAQQPMRAIEETRAVLDQDSTHIGSLQNYAIFLARIGRTDQAIAQMERVKRSAGADSVLVRSANAFIQALRNGPTGAP